MLDDVCAEIKNWFTYANDKYIGDYSVADGTISPLVDFKDTKYFRIIGSRKNNGVHKITDTLVDEREFHGAIWLMSPPKDFLDLVAEIEAWQAKYSEAVTSPYQSESFGGYSYAKASGGNGGTGSSIVPTWKDIFCSRLNRWRRIRE